MGRFTKIPRAGGGLQSVITSRAWNVIAGRLDGLRGSVPAGMPGTESAVGVVSGAAGRRARFLPWRLLVDEVSNEVMVWPHGAFVLGPALDDAGMAEGDATLSPLIPSRYGHPWVPLVGLQAIDVEPYPKLGCPDSTVTYVWVEITLNERVVVFGKDFATTPGVDAPKYGVPLVHDTADPLDVVTTSTESVPGVGGGGDHSHEVAVGDLLTGLGTVGLRVELQMITYDIAGVKLVTSTGGSPPLDDLTTKHYLVGWVDRTEADVPPIIRQFLLGPLNFSPPVFTAWGGTGSTDPEIGLVGGQSGLPPRGESSGDAANSGRGEPV